jgi:hypothetical protein
MRGSNSTEVPTVESRDRRDAEPLGGGDDRGVDRS